VNELELSLIGDKEKKLFDAYVAIFGTDELAKDLMDGIKILQGEIPNPYEAKQ